MSLNGSEHRTSLKFRVAIYIGDNKKDDLDEYNLLDILE